MTSGQTARKFPTNYYRARPQLTVALGGKEEKRAQRFELICSVLVVLLFTLSVGLFWFTCDDAYISFRFAKNFAAGEGLRFNLGAPPVEGYSNFLWVLLCGVIELLNLPMTIVPSLISTFCGVMVLGMVRYSLRTIESSPQLTLLLCSLLALLPPFVVWSTGGLETVPFALAAVLVGLALTTPNQAWLAALAGVYLCLIRVEGPAWATAFLALSVFFNFDQREVFLRKWVWFALTCTATVVSHVIFRWSYYGTIVPHTAQTKVGLSAFTLERGMKYVVSFLLHFPGIALLFLVSLLGVLIIRDRILRYFFLSAAAFFGYSIVVGGDFMAMGRFLVPGLPFLVLACGRTLHQGVQEKFFSLRTAYVLTSLALLLNIPQFINLRLFPTTVFELVHFRFNTAGQRSEYEQWLYMKQNAERWSERGDLLRAYAPPGASLVARAVGAVGYHSDLFIYDQFGLVTSFKQTSMHRTERQSPGHDKYVPVTYFLPESPTYLAAYFFSGPQARERALKRARQWSGQKFAREYVAAFVPEVDGSDKVLIVLERIPEGVRPQEAWRNFFLEQTPNPMQPAHKGLSLFQEFLLEDRSPKAG